jgi:hypothetical protein
VRRSLSKRKLRATKQKRTTIAGAMRDEQHVKKSIKPNSPNKLVSMQRGKRLGKKKRENDERLNENRKKNRGSEMKRGALSSVPLTNSEKRKDKSDMSAEEERILAIDIEAILSLEATTAMKALVCQHRGTEIMIDEQDPELALRRPPLPRRRLLQLMKRAWRKRLCNYS